jgi:hypothetical protein
MLDPVGAAAFLCAVDGLSREIIGALGAIRF